jgi:hypothetical protein
VHWQSPLDRGDTTGDPQQICNAYPDGIPEAIWWNRVDHRQPQPGDHGIGWEPDGDVEYPEYALNT